MKKQIKNYFNEINEYLTSSTNKDLEETIQKHLIKISFFQHIDLKGPFSAPFLLMMDYFSTMDVQSEESSLVFLCCFAYNSTVTSTLESCQVLSASASISKR